MQQNLASLRPVNGTPALPHGLRALTLAASRLRAAQQAEDLTADPPVGAPAVEEKQDVETVEQPAARPAASAPAVPIKPEQLRLVVLLSGAHAFLARRAAGGERLTEDERALVGTIGAELDRAREGLLAFALEEAVALIERPSCAGRIRRTHDHEPADQESLVLTMVRQTARLARSTLATRGVAAALGVLGLSPVQREPVALLSNVFGALADLAESRMAQAEGPAPTLAALVADLRAKLG
jgi:hypothetical protein